jgi:hypothetical protein
MSYKVGGSDVIKSNTKIDWARLKNAPKVGALKHFEITVTNCHATKNLSVTTSASGRDITLNFGTVTGNCVCDCNCNCDAGGGTCFLPSAMVLMADGSLREMQSVRIGDRVMTMRGVGRVIDQEFIFLAAGRSIVSYGDEPPFVTDDHAVWARHSWGEFWGTFNYRHWLFERENSAFESAAAEPHAIPLVPGRGAELAHVSGWLLTGPRYYSEFPSRTPLMNLVVDHGSYIVNGFVFSSMFASRPSAIHRGDLRWRGLAALAADLPADLATEMV